MSMEVIKDISLEAEIQSKFRNEHHKVLVNLIYTYNYISGCLQKILHDKNVTMQQFNILRILRGAHPEPVSNGMIRERMLDKNSDVTRIIDRLIKDGYVIRNACKEDRRRVNISITEKGLEQLTEIDKVSCEMDKITNSLSEDEANQLNILLDKIRHSTSCCDNGN